MHVHGTNGDLTAETSRTCICIRYIYLVSLPTTTLSLLRLPHTDWLCLSRNGGIAGLNYWSLELGWDAAPSFPRPASTLAPTAHSAATVLTIVSVFVRISQYSVRLCCAVNCVVLFSSGAGFKWARDLSCVCAYHMRNLMPLIDAHAMVTRHVCTIITVPHPHDHVIIN